ncbi:hypothetical protein F4775DRAFT_318452 [Biscogniauxia sp. FL1348]|nr:hypothetical protein F4775DRAFT_318452 [Biscogniauxia sp. FL1348]
MTSRGSSLRVLPEKLAREEDSKVPSAVYPTNSSFGRSGYKPDVLHSSPPLWVGWDRPTARHISLLHFFLTRPTFPPRSLSFSSPSPSLGVCPELHFCKFSPIHFSSSCHPGLQSRLGKPHLAYITHQYTGLWLFLYTPKRPPATHTGLDRLERVPHIVPTSANARHYNPCSSSSPATCIIKLSCSPAVSQSGLDWIYWPVVPVLFSARC